MKKPYKPRDETASILDRAWYHVQSVNYRVSTRWVFYRLLQDGVYSDKREYNKLKDILSDARKRFYNEWRPDTLADDTRRLIFRGAGYRDEKSLIEEMPATVADSIGEISHLFKQDKYIEIWFEARAMSDQFSYYTSGITLCPFGGDPSISFKWDIAKNIENVYKVLQKPVTILYFGDLDTKGKIIPISAAIDIQTWCDVPFDFQICGLNKEQVKRYNVPENYEKPGDYQWEALTDEQAADIILSSIKRYIDLDLIESYKMANEALKNKWRPRVENAVREMIYNHL